MSHFVLFVLGDGDLEERLASFSENNESCFEFKDMTDEWREEWESKGSKDVHPKRRLGALNIVDHTACGQPVFEEPSYNIPMKPGDLLVCGGDQWYEVWFSTACPQEDSVRYVVRSVPESPDVPFTTQYPEFGKFAEAYYGGHPGDDERWGYFSNPSAKWDWWVIGGRWADYLQAGFNDDQDCTDFLIGELDMVAIFDQADQEAERRWQLVRSIMPEGVFDGFRTFENWVDSDDWDAEAFDAQPARKALKSCLSQIEDAACEDDKDWARWLDFGRGSFDELCLPLDKYVEYRKAQSVSPIAFLTEDDEWMERAEMGWFGASHDPRMSHADWTIESLDRLLTLHPQTRVRVVDCHI